MVTGASSGLGVVVARELAAHGARVIMAVRDIEKGRRVRDVISDSTGGDLEVRQLDLADLDSVRRFATTLRDQGSPLDLLVNNAGIGGGPRTLTSQGYERTFATNFLGPFALTAQLFELLSAGRDPRVVTVTSNLYKRVKVSLPLDDPSSAQSYSSGKAYVASKLADLIFALELDRRSRAVDSPVRSLAAHPGVVDTPLQRGGGSPLERTASLAFRLAFGRPVGAGALPMLFAATAEHAQTGKLLGPSLKKGDLRIHAEAIQTPANDQALALRLWQTAETLTKTPFAPV